MNTKTGEIRMIGQGEAVGVDEVMLTPNMHAMLREKCHQDRLDTYYKQECEGWRCRGEGKNGADVKRLKRVGRL